MRLTGKLNRRLNIVAVVFLLIASLVMLLTLLGFLNPSHWYLTLAYWERNQPIIFYGQVVDQAGEPIEGATVSITIECFDWSTLLGSHNYLTNRQLSLSTDAAGRFVVSRVSGLHLFVNSVSHPGYLTIPEPKWGSARLAIDGFTYSRDHAVPFYIPDIAKPAVFPLRQSGEPRQMVPQRGGSEAMVWNKANTSAPFVRRHNYFGVVSTGLAITLAALLLLVPARHQLGGQCVIAIGWIYTLVRIAPQSVSSGTIPQVIRWAVFVAGLVATFWLVPAVRKRLARRWAWFASSPQATRGFEVKSERRGY